MIVPVKVSLEGEACRGSWKASRMRSERAVLLDSVLGWEEGGDDSAGDRAKLGGQNLVIFILWRS